MCKSKTYFCSLVFPFYVALGNKAAPKLSHSESVATNSGGSRGTNLEKIRGCSKLSLGGKIFYISLAHLIDARKDIRPKKFRYKFYEAVKNHCHRGSKLWVPRTVGANNPTAKKVSAKVSKKKFNDGLRKNPKGDENSWRNSPKFNADSQICFDQCEIIDRRSVEVVNMMSARKKIAGL